MLGTRFYKYVLMGYIIICGSCSSSSYSKVASRLWKCWQPIPSSNTPLIDNLVSFISPDEARSRIHTSEENWKIVEKPTKRNPEDTRPRFDILTIEVEHYVSIGISGRLRLEFFNDRLKDTKFFPSDVSTYKRNLASKTGIRLDDGKITLQPRTLVIIGRMITGEDFILFRDAYLQDELECWVINYS